MINLLLFLFFIACASFAVAILADNPGNVVMHWYGYEIETSVVFIILATVVFSIITILITLLIRKIFSAPAYFFNRRKVKNLQSGISEITYSVAALAASNIPAAEKHVRKVEKLIGQTPLTLLLSAQIAKSSGDEHKTQALLEQLLKYRETEYIATRTLSDNAVRQNNLPQALQLAKKAQEIEPKNGDSALAIINLQIRIKQWDEALSTLQKSSVARNEKKRIKALIAISRGNVLLDEGYEEQALALAKLAISTLPLFIPAIIFAARAYHKNGEQNRAIRLLNRSLREQPSSLLLETLENIIEGEKQERKIKILAAFREGIKENNFICKICGHEEKNWSIHCNSCHSFDSMELK